MSTSGDVQYIGGNHEYIGGYHDTCGDIMIHVGEIMVHVGGYHEYIGRCSVHQGMFSRSGDVQENRGFSIEIERILSSCSPTCIMISL